MHYEVEQKFRVASLGPVAARLTVLGAVTAGELSQSDQYFAHPDRDFAQTDEALRIRSVGEKNYVTYKGPKVDTTTKTRRELELPLATGSAGRDQFAELLEALGFRRVAEVRKRRMLYALGYGDRSVEVALDDVDRVGQFVELELSADEAGLAPARECLAALAAELGLSANERRSYLEMLLAGTT